MAVRRQRQSLEADAAMMQQQEEQDNKLEMMEELRGAHEGEEEDDAAGGKRRLFRFKPAFDVVLVREVIRCFPWAAGYGRTRSAWMSVATRVQATLESAKGVSFSRGSALDHAIVKRRVDMLLEAHRKNEMSGLRGSGTPEEFDMRNKLLAILARVSALQVALHSLAELDGKTGIALPVSAGLTPPPSAAATPPPASLMPIAPAPLSVTAVPTRASPSPSPVPQSMQQSAQHNVQQSMQHNVQQNGRNKRPLRSPTVPAATTAQEVKRPRMDKTMVDVSSSFEERKLRLEERRVAIEEERLAWDKQKAQQDAKERQALLDVLRTQGSLVTELLAHLRSTKMSMSSHDL
ncbi:unnamed protein product [Phytophthora lilii]|uniref:Unnamed protein product n=1 Tax=Phytophthora lilii TaxID=2077276 RepID=A0A9W6TSY7_9STRA|nr:unnamed protein product [Phytophthora lilii]